MVPTATETYICGLYDLTPEQIASACSYVLNNPDTVLAEHLRIESRMAAGNPPQVIEQPKHTHATFLSFKRWLAEREQAAAQERAAEATSGNERNGPNRLPTFRK